MLWFNHSCNRCYSNLRLSLGPERDVSVLEARALTARMHGPDAWRPKEVSAESSVRSGRSLGMPLVGNAGCCEYCSRRCRSRGVRFAPFSVRGRAWWRRDARASRRGTCGGGATSKLLLRGSHHASTHDLSPKERGPEAGLAERAVRRDGADQSPSALKRGQGLGWDAGTRAFERVAVGEYRPLERGVGVGV